MESVVADLPLRDRKRAQTRIDLVDALTQRLADRPLDDIQVAELAAAANISPATFFNYFPTKGHLLIHFIQLWSLEMSALAHDVQARHRSPLKALESLFRTTAEHTAKHPRVMLEIIAQQARTPLDSSFEPVEEAERKLYLPHAQDVENLSDRGLTVIIPGLLREAIDQGELPADTHVGELTLAVSSLFFGIPLIVGNHQPTTIPELQQRLLGLLWAGAKETWTE